MKRVRKYLKGIRQRVLGRKRVGEFQTPDWKEEAIEIDITRPESIWVTVDDLIAYSPLTRFIYALLAWELAFVGSFFIWLGLVFWNPIFADWQYTLLAFEIVGSLGFALLAWSREILVKKVATRGFAFIFRFQRLVFESYYGAFLVAIYPLLTVKTAIPLSPFFPISPLSVVAIGVFFFLIIPRLVISELLRETRVPRLSILQFTLERKTGNPRYSWLRIGMRGIEWTLGRSGLSVTPGVLYHGSCYSLFKDNLPNSDLGLLAEWLTFHANFRQVNSIILGLMWQSAHAEDSGFGKVRGIWGRISRLPFPKGYNIVVAIGAIAGSITAIVELAKIFGMLHA